MDKENVVRIHNGRVLSCRNEWRPVIQLSETSQAQRDDLCVSSLVVEASKTAVAGEDREQSSLGTEEGDGGDGEGAKHNQVAGIRSGVP